MRAWPLTIWEELSGRRAQICSLRSSGFFFSLTSFKGGSYKKASSGSTIRRIRTRSYILAGQHGLTQEALCAPSCLSWRRNQVTTERRVGCKGDVTSGGSLDK